jgi:dipeptidyl aminopeptidase/acylaminoacyl peptidase
MRKFCGRSWLVVLLAALCFSARGNQSIPLPMDDLLRIKTLQNAPVNSPDGHWTAYTVKTRPQFMVIGNDDAVKRGLTPHLVGGDIFVCDLLGRQQRNLTGENGDSWSPSWSPDSRYLAFLSNRSGGEQPELWVWDSHANALKKVSEVAARIWGVQQIEWSADSKRIFIAAVPGQLSGKAFLQKVIEAGTAPKHGNTTGSTVLLYSSSGKPEEGQANGNTLGIDERLRDLIAIDLASGKGTTLLSNQRISEFYVTRDNLRLVYSCAKGFEKSGSQQVLYDLDVLDLRSLRQTVAATAVPLDYFGRFSVSPDGSLISFRSNPDSPRISDIFVVSVNGGEVKKLSRFTNSPSFGPLTGDWKRNFSVTPLWDRESQHVYSIGWRQLWESSVRAGITRRVGRIEGHTIAQVVASTDNVLGTTNDGKSAVVVARDEWTKREGLYGIDLENGTNSTIAERGHCYTCEAARDARYIASVGSSLIYVAEDAQHPADVWRTDFVSGQTSRLTHLNPQFDSYEMGATELVDWLDGDGHRLRGALWLPSSYVPGKRYPLIVLVYGGALPSGTVNRFAGFERGMPYFNPQLFATRGYAFFAPDAPQQLGTPMLDLAKTVLPGINRVIEKGIADPERIGIMGHSYGGYSTLALLVQTKRFKAAVEADGMADLISAYGEMEKDGTAFGTSSETGQELMGGSPWEVRDRYIENSPLFSFDRMDTPLLIVHGGDDRAVASFLGDEIFVALRRLGKIVTYAKYEGESHVPSAFGNQVDIGTRIIEWFDRYLKETPEKSDNSS